MQDLLPLLLNVRPFMILFARVLGVVATAPVFGSALLPHRVVGALAMFVAFVLFPVVGGELPQADLSATLDALLVVKELAVGLTLGLVARMAFASLQVAGQFMGMELGFAVAEVADPTTTGGRTSLLGQLYTVVSTLTFIGINGHHWFLLALAKSYEAVPVMGYTASAGLAAAMLNSFAKFYMLGIQIAIPVVTCLVLATVAIGILAKTVPQVNILQMGFALRIALGVLCLIVFMPVLGLQMNQLFTCLRDEVFRALSLM